MYLQKFLSIILFLHNTFDRVLVIIHITEMGFYFQSTFVWDSNDWKVKQQFSFHQGKEDNFIFKTLINPVCHKTLNFCLGL